MCLADPNCQSFQVQASASEYCNLFNVPTSGNVEYAPADVYTFFDRDCSQYLPPACSSAPAKKAKRDVPIPSYIPATVPPSRISSACSCLITSPDAVATSTVVVPQTSVATATVGFLRLSSCRLWKIALLTIARRPRRSSPRPRKSWSWSTRRSLRSAPLRHEAACLQLFPYTGMFLSSFSTGPRGTGTKKLCHHMFGTGFHWLVIIGRMQVTGCGFCVFRPCVFYNAQNTITSH